MNSMTGFGKSKKTHKGYEVAVEVSSLNSRHLDVHVRLPKSMGELEFNARKVVERMLSRGKVNANIEIRKTGRGSRSALFNFELLEREYRALSETARKLGIREEVGISELLSLMGILEENDILKGSDGMEGAVLICLGEAVENMARMRTQEGKKTGDVLNGLISKVGKSINSIDGMSSEVLTDAAERIRKRILEILGDRKLDDTRVLQEAGLLAEKYDVCEEISRIRGHIKAFKSALNEKGAVGKKLEFLQQEMSREVNTLGSKSYTYEMQSKCIGIKISLERIREIAQNVE